MSELRNAAVDAAFNMASATSTVPRPLKCVEMRQLRRANRR